MAFKDDHRRGLGKILLSDGMECSDEKQELAHNDSQSMSVTKPPPPPCLIQDQVQQLQPLSTGISNLGWGLKLTDTSRTQQRNMTRVPMQGASQLGVSLLWLSAIMHTLGCLMVHVLLRPICRIAPDSSRKVHKDPESISPKTPWRGSSAGLYST